MRAWRDCERGGTVDAGAIGGGASIAGFWSTCGILRSIAACLNMWLSLRIHPGLGTWFSHAGRFHRRPVPISVRSYRFGGRSVGVLDVCDIPRFNSRTGLVFSLAVGNVEDLGVAAIT